MDGSFQHPRFWKFFKNARGDRIVEQFITAQAASDAAAIAVAMRRVQEKGVQAARHLRDEIYEVRVAGDKKQFRILFATEGAYNQVLLALESFSKKTQKTPPDKIELAEQRLAEWRRLGEQMRGERAPREQSGQ